MFAMCFALAQAVSTPSYGTAEIWHVDRPTVIVPRWAIRRCRPAKAEPPSPPLSLSTVLPSRRWLLRVVGVGRGAKAPCRTVSWPGGSGFLFPPHRRACAHLGERPTKGWASVQSANHLSQFIDNIHNLMPYICLPPAVCRNGNPVAAKCSAHQVHDVAARTARSMHATSRGEGGLPAAGLVA